MWYHEEERLGKSAARKSRPNRRRFVLSVNTRLNAQKRATVGHATSLSFVFLGFLVAGGGLFFGLREVGKQIFSFNDRFQIQRVVVQTDKDAVIGESLIREYIPITEGMNIFKPDIGAIRAEFLRRMPNIRSLWITRRIPDTIQIVVSERVPVASIQQKPKPDLCVDDRGFIFSSRIKHRDLPVITGCPTRLKDGQYVEGLLDDAVVLLDTLNQLPAVSEVDVLAVNVRGGFEGKPDALRLSLPEDVDVDIWWEKTRDGYDRKTHSKEDLRDRLYFLGGVLRKAKQEGRSLARVNLTLENYRENCPVTPK